MDRRSIPSTVDSLPSNTNGRPSAFCQGPLRIVLAVLSAMLALVLGFGTGMVLIATARIDPAGVLATVAALAIWKREQLRREWFAAAAALFGLLFALFASPNPISHLATLLGRWVL